MPMAAQILHKMAAALATLLLSNQVLHSQTKCLSGYSENATIIAGVPGKKEVSIYGKHQRLAVINSPDGSASLWAELRTSHIGHSNEDWRLEFRVSFRGRLFRTHVQGRMAEILWSPDSKAFAVTASDDLYADYRVTLFYLGESSLRVVDPTPFLRREFGPTKCEPHAPPNTAAISWLKDLSAVLLVAEVIPVSYCRDMGTFKVYEVRVPQPQIIRTYDEGQARSLFANVLGCNLRQGRLK
jgi:hypothetical protein